MVVYPRNWEIYSSQELLSVGRCGDAGGSDTLQAPLWICRESQVLLCATWGGSKVVSAVTVILQETIRTHLENIKLLWLSSVYFGGAILNKEPKSAGKSLDAEGEDKVHCPGGRRDHEGHLENW